ncbi:MAG: hypothetical protein IJM09_00555 [Neisseriaceae bacterium]|nr:hypothetical protein [Neisseriaceae bacterium]
MSENNFETQGRAMDALQDGQTMINAPFEISGRLSLALKNGGSGGGGMPDDYEQLKNQVAQNSERLDSIDNSQTEQDTKIAQIAAFLGLDLDHDFIELPSNQGVKLVGAKSIDTGLTMDGENFFHYKGCLMSTQNQGMVVGAYQSNTARTTLKMLGQSQKFQSQWADNMELENSKVSIPYDFTKPITIWQRPNQTIIVQQLDPDNPETYSENIITNSGYRGRDDDTKIYLFNQTQNGDYNHCVLFFVEIATATGTVLFKPMIKRNIKTGEETLIMTKNGEEIPLPSGARLELVTF